MFRKLPQFHEGKMATFSNEEKVTIINFMFYNYKCLSSAQVVLLSG